MRSVVLLIMIALMPLRMWAAEGMAVGIAQAGMGVAHHTMAVDSAMPEDCPMMAVTSPAALDSGEPASTTDHKACLACQLCAALAPNTTFAAARHATPTAPPIRAIDRFASVDPVPELKPPIS